MMAVGMAADKAQFYIDRVTGVLGDCRLAVACVNSPTNVTVSGEEAHIDHLKSFLDADKVFCRKLRVGVAYHYLQMQEIADQYLEKIGSLDSSTGTKRQSRTAMVSSVTGTWIVPEVTAKPEYWVRNLVSPVLFADALATMVRPQAGTGVDTLLEVGPHSALQGPIRETLKNIEMESKVTYASLLSRGASAVESLLGATGRLHCLGHSLALGRVNRDHDGAMVTVTNLPPYSFNHSKAYWHESRASRGYRHRQHPAYPHLGAPEADFNPLEAKWRNIIRTGDIPWVEDHKINGTILYPAAGMIVMAIEAAHQLADPEKTVAAYVLKNVTLHSALNLLSNKPSVGVEVNLFVRPRRDQDGKNAGWFDFRLCMYDDGTHTWSENCHGSIQLVYELEKDGTGRATGIDKGREERLWCASLCREYHDMVAACSTTLETGKFYSRLAEWGFNYGPAFRDMTAVASDSQGGAVIEVKTFEPPPGTAHAEHIVHPATLDCIFQLIIVAMTNAGTVRLVTGIPTHFDRIYLSATGLSYPHAQSLKAYGTAKRLGLRQTETSIGVVDASGTHALLKIDGFVATDISGSIEDADEQTGPSTTPLCHAIEWKPDLATSSDAQILRLRAGEHDAATSSGKFHSELDLLAAAYLQRAADKLDPKAEASLMANPRSKLYFQWMQRWLDSRHTSQDLIDQLAKDDRIEDVAARISATNKLGDIYTSVGGDLLRLLQAPEEDAREIVQNYYSELVRRHRLLAHSHSSRSHAILTCRLVVLHAGCGTLWADSRRRRSQKCQCAYTRGGRRRGRCYGRVNEDTRTGERSSSLWRF